MALRAVPDHPKFAQLKALLNQPKGPAAGWLEMMWHFTGRFTPQGNIGKYPDTAIEAWVEWNGKPGELIETLVASGWIDRDPVHRLLVHDWAHHADKATKNALMRSKTSFCVPSVRTELPNRTDVVPQQAEPLLRSDGSTPLISECTYGVRTESSFSGTASRLPGAVPVPVPVPVPGGAPGAGPHDSKAEASEGLPATALARGLMNECNIPKDWTTERAASAAIEAHAKERSIPLHVAAAELIELVRSALALGDIVNRFWFTDGKYRTVGRKKIDSSRPHDPCATGDAPKWDDAIEYAKIREKQAAGEKVGPASAEFAKRWERKLEYDRKLQEQLSQQREASA